MDPLFGNPAARYDALKLNWLGSIGKLQNVCATWHTSPIKTIQQAQEREVVVAAAAAPTNTAIMPRVLNALLGTKFKPIIGYDPGSGLTMAIERQEAEGICGLSWSTMKASRPHWISQNLLNVIVQMGIDKLPDLPNVPAALDLVTDAEKKQILTLILLRQEPGRPVAAPPGVPADRLAALRAGFRRHHEGRGLHRRGGETADGDRTADRDADRQALGHRLRHAEADRAAGRPTAGAAEIGRRSHRRPRSFKLSSPRRRGRQLRIGHGQSRRQLIPPRGEEKDRADHQHEAHPEHAHGGELGDLAVLPEVEQRHRDQLRSRADQQQR